MINFFLKSNELIKMNMLYSLAYGSMNSTEEYILRFGSSRTAILRTTSQLVEDVESLYPEQSIIHVERDRYSLNNSLSLNKSIMLDSLLSKYIRNSSHFLVLDYLVKNEQSTLQELTEMSLISDTHCETLIKELNEMLATYSITISKEKNHYLLDGKEMNLRHFLFYFILNFVRMDYLEKSSLAENKVVFSIKDSNYPVYRLLIFKTILEERIIFDDKQLIDDVELLDIIYVYQQVGSFFSTTLYSPSQAINNFHLRIIFPQIGDADSRIELGKLLNKMDNTIVDSVKGIMTYYFDEFFEHPVTGNVFFESLYFLVTKVAYLKIFKFNYYEEFLFKELASLTPEILDETKSWFDAYYPSEIIESDLDIDFKSPVIRNEFVHFIGVLYSLEHPVQVAVFIDSSSTKTVGLSESHHFTQIFNKKTIRITRNYWDADIVIVDHNIAQASDKRVFRFSSKTVFSEISSFYRTVVEVHSQKYKDEVSKKLEQIRLKRELEKEEHEKI